MIIINFVDIIGIPNDPKTYSYTKNKLEYNICLLYNINIYSKISMNLVNYLCEFIGTFILISVILMVGEPIPIAVALLAGIYLVGKVSGGHMNPPVTMSMYIKR